MHRLVIDLTRELLSYGVFNHLPDSDVARLHWIILQQQVKYGRPPVETLLSYWYRGDYYSADVPIRLLQQCNALLVRLGQPLIEVYIEECFDA